MSVVILKVVLLFLINILCVQKVGNMVQKQLKEHIEEKFDISFNDEQLVYTAITHSSYANDHREEEIEHLERLEFLGDAVIELIVSNYLYNEYKKMPEGELTKLRAGAVREETLADLAIETGLQPFILLGKGENQANGRNRKSLLSDVFEAFIGAIYLDQGISTAETILAKVLFPKINTRSFSYEMDYKTELQEWLQKDGVVDIRYQVIDETGPDHAREFKAAVYVENDILGVGVGTSKKKAEQAAAKEAYKQVK